MSGGCDKRVSPALLGLITDTLVVANDAIDVKADDDKSIVVGASTFAFGVSCTVGVRKERALLKQKRKQSRIIHRLYTKGYCRRGFLCLH